MTEFKIKRAYADAAPSDGWRVLVDRLWPRGLGRERAALDEWAKNLAPSTELRKWFAHDPEKFAEFSRRYARELRENADFERILDSWCEHETVTLLFAAKDEAHNNAAALARILAAHERAN